MKIDKIPDSIDPALDLDIIRAECLELVQKRAYISAGAAVVPVPFLDVVIDVGILSQLIPEVNARFGLAPEQISVYDPETKQVTKFIPLGGQIIAASLGYMVMKKVAAAHVEDCYSLAKDIQKKQNAQLVG